WYWPCACSGARLKPSDHDPAACSISPNTWTSAPDSSTATATQVGCPAASANKAQHTASRNPASRIARAPPGTSALPRPVRTWNSTTVTALRITTSGNSHAGALVCWEIQIGSATISSPEFMIRILLPTDPAAYGTSRSTGQIGPSPPCAAGATRGTRRYARPATTNSVPAVSSSVRYATRVSRYRPTAPPAAPTTTDRFAAA